MRKERDRRAIQREIEICSSLNHPSIVKLHTTFEDDHYVHLIFEHCGDQVSLLRFAGVCAVYQISVVKVDSQKQETKKQKHKDLSFVLSIFRLIFNLIRKSLSFISPLALFDEQNGCTCKKDSHQHSETPWSSDRTGDCLSSYSNY